jgi:release factor glutamine methyltransferase
MATIANSLSAARAAGLDRLDADLLLLHALSASKPERTLQRSWLLAHDGDDVPPLVQTHFQQMLLRRCAGEPLAYIVGRKEFFGMDLRVDARVLVPRPDTETLVEWALSCLDTLPTHQAQDTSRLLDLGTGSGAIALAIKQARPTVAVDAVDASADALALARSNASELGLDIQWLQGSWFEPVRQRYHVIVSNPPYIEDEDPHLPDLRYEPVQALTSGPDGLNDIRQIIAGASLHLVPGGWLLLEHGFDQGLRVQTLLQAVGLQNVASRHDLGGHWRCTGGQREGDGPGYPGPGMPTDPGR